MDSDSDTDFFSENALRRKLQKLRKYANKNRSPDIQKQEDSISSGPEYRSPRLEEPDSEDTIKVMFPVESLEVFKYAIHRSDRFLSVFKQLSILKNVPFDFIELVMMPNNRDVSQYDSLESLNFTSGHYFYAYTKNSLLVSAAPVNNGTGNIEIKCATHNKRMIYKMYDDQPLEILIGYCARDFNCGRKHLELRFDGEIVRPYDTCSSLEIMNGEIIEVNFLS